MQPQTLKGFNDYFADDVSVREYVINSFKKGFEKYGYEPLETPALEYTELMRGFSGDEFEKLFYRLKDQGERDVMLKAEVMMGMCRAVASNIDRIVFPYKRYQIQNVWRAENVQKGRLREFTQCDADTIGSASMVCDAEFIQMGLEITKNFGFKQFRARISNRKYLTGLAEALGVPSEKFYGMCMSLDKLEKIGVEKVRSELVEVRGLEKDTVSKILSTVDPGRYIGLSEQEKIGWMEKVVGGTEAGREGLDELKQIFDYFDKAKLDPSTYTFDTALARGLAHYTGPIWEFEIIEGGIGSIAGCGRYDNIIGTYVGGGRQIPATGGSFGIERICMILKDRKMIEIGKAVADVLVTVFDPDSLKESLDVARTLRDSGVPTLLYPDVVPLGKQFKYADRKGIQWVVVVGPDEVQAKKVQMKNMKTGKQELVDLGAVAKLVMH
jgi:histidyl-tRNA synthetase